MDFRSRLKNSNCFGLDDEFHDDYKVVALRFAPKVLPGQEELPLVLFCDQGSSPKISQCEGDSVEGQETESCILSKIYALTGWFTYVASRDVGLRFDGVHDSFWTHACDVDQMKIIFWEKFVELHSMPLLKKKFDGSQKSEMYLFFCSFVVHEDGE
ncbi:hypothetical protein K7X08_032861 [Anisodus acutangulus]|uniref:DNA-directed RNA polymerase n=1 Tax=Anisodus acutangulus TaxID=402998 RepID=A0A9Q1M5I5_9SOLA|nr:hypothetical protein K7X08_032861 [Anisodus acutangulus]